jgi:hypothetical protein
MDKDAAFQMILISTVQIGMLCLKPAQEITGIRTRVGRFLLLRMGVGYYQEKGKSVQLLSQR